MIKSQKCRLSILKLSIKLILGKLLCGEKRKMKIFHSSNNFIKLLHTLSKQLLMEPIKTSRFINYTRDTSVLQRICLQNHPIAMTKCRQSGNHWIWTVYFRNKKIYRKSCFRKWHDISTINLNDLTSGTPITTLQSQFVRSEYFNEFNFFLMIL